MLFKLPFISQGVLGSKRNLAKGDRDGYYRRYLPKWDGGRGNKNHAKKDLM
jgi:hypothetical protein